MTIEDPSPIIPPRKRCISEGAESNCFENTSISYITSSQTIYYSIDSSEEALDTITIRPNTLTSNEELFSINQTSMATKPKTVDDKKVSLLAL